jgi:ectoine hydroxylase-related dioxygenase (phytanoyl-CoA dioxygenase family)
VQIWLPIFQKNSKNGQLSFIKESHKWGHVPHSNKKPLNLPKKYQILNTNLEDRDALIFSTTLMHRSQETYNPRLGLAMTVKNFKYDDLSYSDNFNWRIFSYSEITKIQRILGNHYLSPFRLMDINNKIEFN